MDQETTQTIKERFSELPKELRDAITASDLPVRLKNISNNHNLLLDQANILHNEILFVLLGLEPSSEFVPTVSRELQINNEKANLIAKDVNTQIFDSVRSHLMEWEEGANKDLDSQMAEKSSQISSLEKLGGFSIEKSEGSVSNENTSANIDTKSDVSASDRASILYGLENPIPGKKEVATGDTHTDPLIDHLLANPVSTTEQKVITSEVVKKPAVINKPSGMDPYREPIK